MRVQFLLVPYDSGHREWRMGCGPGYLLRHGAGSSVRALGHEVDAEYVELDAEAVADAGAAAAPAGTAAAPAPASARAPAPAHPGEVPSSFALYGRLSRRVRALRDEGALPIVLGGNCGVTVGALAGGPAPHSGIGVVWLDAHGDFNTPETTTSGFLDGMALAVLTGRCWRAMAAQIPGFAPVPERHVVLVGARDLDGAEQAALEESEIARVTGAEVRDAGLEAALAPVLDRLRERVARVHLHVDLDVLDAAEARANSFAAPGGLTSAELATVVREVADRFEIVSAALTAFDPAAGDAAMVVHAAAGALEAIVAPRAPA